ncbi:hypothetical protein STCU_05694 [Strigomonas culicis]|uniref:Uncharacterized protein n=1 Tax=Strigomonas culicis TaxID=28005 RepID=S9VKD1_9TRYP|nr:hypothetical protein STCU_09270 [Strigomonas culicis]EPY27551.1 hypothetical protein STCU_05694 [Strigomonas culicis]|eukprot:EPY19839.1 hypothetical protein STCU_09270 [Strigomonas culicis]
MLGSQSWFTALAIPTIFFGGFIASRKRLAYQWKEELLDVDSPCYPTVTEMDMEFFRRVTPAMVTSVAEKGSRLFARRRDEIEHNKYGVPLHTADNIGFFVATSVIPEEYINVYLNEIREWAETLGNAVDSRKVTSFVNNLLLSSAGRAADGTATKSPLRPVDGDFYSAVRVIADHAEDIQLMKAPWHCGDGIDLDKMPPALRVLAARAQRAFEGVGRLRHVYMEYSPAGKFFREPRSPKSFDGHDYVVIPFRRDGAGTVVTLSPVFRSKFSSLLDVMQNSWTSRDIDCLVPSGGMLRVYGQARYDWGWGIRPGPRWFGSRLNSVECASARHGTERSFLDFLHIKSKLGSQSASSVAATGPSARDAALVVLHFEGPRAKNKKRSLLFEPEIWIFGKQPTVETYEQWEENRPTEESVRQEGVVRFMMRNYMDMLTKS